MSKNIILCADGTGNKGGYTPDSNVYKMYNAVEIHDTAVPQYTFYDNGVGTSTNKYWRAITGGIGLGIRDNIKDLYQFLALHYEPGDRVYLFGFSRGAATIRAFCGMIKAVGLVKGNGLDDRDLKNYTNDAFKAYESHLKNPEKARDFRKHNHSHNIIDIHFVGVWDTVAALGFPKRTDKTSITLFVLSAAFKMLEKLSNKIWPHKFYNYELSDNIKFACQALAIDDERTAFWPLVWDEKGRDSGSVDQVWFAGMHSNVGGGYERQGIANVAFHWMMLRAENHGMTFKHGVLDKVYQDSNIHGRLYNSRDGLAVYYRYHPREIQKLCDKKLSGSIKLHCSALERMRKRTANYAPFVLPDKFSVVDSAGTEVKSVDTSQNDEVIKQQDTVNSMINKRKWLYGNLADLTLLMLAYIIYMSCTNNPDGVSLLSLVIDSVSKGDVIALLKNLYEYHLHAVFVFFTLGLCLAVKRASVIEKMIAAAEKVRKAIV